MWRRSRRLSKKRAEDSRHGPENSIFEPDIALAATVWFMNKCLLDCGHSLQFNGVRCSTVHCKTVVLNCSRPAQFITSHRSMQSTNHHSSQTAIQTPKTVRIWPQVLLAVTGLCCMGVPTLFGMADSVRFLTLALGKPRRNGRVRGCVPTSTTWL